jgi:hypothetical protein
MVCPALLNRQARREDNHWRREQSSEKGKSLLPTCSSCPRLYIWNLADEYISVSDVFKLVTEPFSRNKRKLKEFCENVEAAFGLIDSDKYDLFYKY